MKKTFIILASLLIMVSCRQNNPFYSEWNTPYGIPPYEAIKIKDYLPAIKEGIRQQQAEIDAIIANEETPDFDNVVGAYELSGELLRKVTGVLFNVAETENCPELEKVVDQASGLLSSHSDNINMNPGLYRKVKALYDADQSSLTREQQMVLKNLYESFTRNGIGLDEEKQARLRAINSELTAKINKIGNNILAENNAFREKFGFSVSEYPVRMASTDDRALREQYFKAYSMRGHNGNAHDNRMLILDVMRLRTEKAKLMGFDNSADYILNDKMAHDHGTVDAFLAGIMKPAVAKARAEIKAMEAISGEKILPWDWWYYAEKVRKKKYELDENLVRPYFSAENVKKGIFTAAKILYDINVEEIFDVPVYNKEVDTYKITDSEGSLIGIFTTDYFPRTSKRGGAWMNNVRSQYIDADGNDIRPIIVNVGNFSSPDSTGLALLTIDEVETAFHEFGHALHGLLSKCNYPSVSGTNVARDFVEVFSQFNENWAFRPELLKQYAVHYESGEVIPQELVEKINAVSKFNQGFRTTELCAASILDMKWHELSEIPADASMDFVDEFEAKVCKDMGLIEEIIPRYRSTYFNHIFSSGYSAGYYGYLWAELLDKDAFSIFEASPNGVFDHELSTKFKETFLEKGGSEEPMILYKSFVGREPDNAAFLRGRGL